MTNISKKVHGLPLFLGTDCFTKHIRGIRWVSYRLLLNELNKSSKVDFNMVCSFSLSTLVNIAIWCIIEFIKRYCGYLQINTDLYSFYNHILWYLQLYKLLELCSILSFVMVTSFFCKNMAKYKYRSILHDEIRKHYIKCLFHIFRSYSYFENIIFRTD